MQTIVLLATSIALLSSCHENEVSIEVTKTRRLTYFDQKPPRNILDKPPLGWRAIPTNRFRDTNFLAGKDDSVEIYASSAKGSVLANANRWLGQFGQKEGDELTDYRVLKTVKIIDRTSYLVEASGTFDPGRGQDVNQGYGLVGAIRQTNDELLTIKMVGPAEEVAKLRSEFITYCESMKLTEVTDIEDEEERKKKAEAEKQKEAMESEESE